MVPFAGTGRALTRRFLLLAFALWLVPVGGVHAGDRLLATPGASPLGGGAGGGLSPWAVIAGYGTAGQWGGSAFATRVTVDDYRLDSAGIALGFSNRLELSVAHQQFDLGTLGAAIGRPGAELRQNILGAKLRLLGDLVYTAWPQVALGVQHKTLLDPAIPRSVGAEDDRGLDIYLSASKLWLAGPWGRSLLVNATLRATKANQLGLLGFGGDRRSGHSMQFEGSVALFLDRHTAIGLEYRQKPDNLGFAVEDDWRDVFLAWIPNKRFSVVAAYTRLGTIGGLADQRGPYLSVQLSY